MNRSVPKKQKELSISKKGTIVKIPHLTNEMLDTNYFTKVNLFARQLRISSLGFDYLFNCFLWNKIFQQNHPDY